MPLLINFLLDPIVLLWLLALAVLILRILNKNRSSTFFLWAATLWFFIISISPVPQWLTRNLEHRYPVFKLQYADISPNKEIHILILGGGHSISPSLPATSQLSVSALCRLTEAIRIHLQIPESKIVGSGYSSSGRTSVAEMTVLAALELGVQPIDTLMVITPENTAAEARDYVKRFGKAQELIIVTDALHMPRAMKYFECQGLKPIPAPANYIIKIDPVKSTYTFKPGLQKIQMMEDVLHEYAGFLAFHLGIS